MGASAQISHLTKYLFYRGTINQNITSRLTKCLFCFASFTSQKNKINPSPPNFLYSEIMDSLAYLPNTISLSSSFMQELDAHTPQYDKYSKYYHFLINPDAGPSHIFPFGQNPMGPPSITLSQYESSTYDDDMSDTLPMPSYAPPPLHHDYTSDSPSMPSCAPPSFPDEYTSGTPPMPTWSAPSPPRSSRGFVRETIRRVGSAMGAVVSGVCLICCAPVNKSVGN